MLSPRKEVGEDLLHFLSSNMKSCRYFVVPLYYKVGFTKFLAKCYEVQIFRFFKLFLQ